MAGLHKDKRTGIYAVQFYDSDRSPKRKQVYTGTRDLRTARRLHRRWEAAYAEGRYDAWADRPPVAHEEAPARTVVTVTLASSRDAFLESRSHLALNTRLNYERVVGRFVTAVGEGGRRRGGGHGTSSAGSTVSACGPSRERTTSGTSGRISAIARH
jgi:hypothetical protein